MLYEVKKHIQQTTIQEIATYYEENNRQFPEWIENVKVKLEELEQKEEAMTKEAGEWIKTMESVPVTSAYLFGKDYFKTREERKAVIAHSEELSRAIRPFLFQVGKELWERAVENGTIAEEHIAIFGNTGYIQ